MHDIVVYSFRLYSDVGKTEYMIMDSGLITSIIYYHCTHCVVPLLLLIELDKLEDKVFIINRETMSKTIMPKIVLYAMY